MQELEIRPLGATVWGDFWSGGVIALFFFETDKETAVTVNGERYRDMIFTQLWPNLEVLEIDNFWFQLDEATCHPSRETLALLLEGFPERAISLHGDKEWQPKSCDLTHCDFFV